jgi:hypothetical protein
MSSDEDWVGYAAGYWRGAEVIANHVATTGHDQDILVFPFLMCWRHHVELQLKSVIGLLQRYLDEDVKLRMTHEVDQLWRLARGLLERAEHVGEGDDIANVERVLLQLHELDPTSEHFRYPVARDGSPTLAGVRRLHIGRFHEAMVNVAHFLDACDTGFRDMLGVQAEFEAEIIAEIGQP